MNFFFPTAWAIRLCRGIHPAGKEIKNHITLITIEFVYRHKRGIRFAVYGLRLKKYGLGVRFFPYTSNRIPHTVFYLFMASSTCSSVISFVITTSPMVVGRT